MQVLDMRGRAEWIIGVKQKRKHGGIVNTNTGESTTKSALPSAGNDTTRRVMVLLWQRANAKRFSVYTKSVSKPKDSREQASMPSVSENGGEGGEECWRGTRKYVYNTYEAAIFGHRVRVFGFFFVLFLSLYGVLCIGYVLIFAFLYFFYEFRFFSISFRLFFISWFLFTNVWKVFLVVLVPRGNSEALVLVHLLSNFPLSWHRGPSFFVSFFL